MVMMIKIDDKDYEDIFNLDAAKLRQKLDMCILFNLCSLKCSLSELETPCLHKYGVGTFKKRLFLY